MKIICSKNLIDLANRFPCPLFITGGYVRNSLLALPVSDIDIASPLPIAEVLTRLENSSYVVTATYPRLGTAVIFDRDSREKYEYTTFRSDSYPTGGKHTPNEVIFTDNIAEDAKRRDFTINAIYYDIKNDRIVDPLGGLNDLQHNRLMTVTDPDIVFSCDGLRLMRLVRFASELNFDIPQEIQDSAHCHASLLHDISAERIAAEFLKITQADAPYPSRTTALFPHYTGLKLLIKLGLLTTILPELLAGQNLVQRTDFHKYDVLEHSLQTFKFSDPKIRIAALLHDIAKPIQLKETGKYAGHDFAGEKLSYEISLHKLFLSKSESRKISQLVRFHMVDLDCKMSLKKCKLFIVAHHDIFQDLLLLKQADYLGGGLQTDTSPCVIHLLGIEKDMVDTHTPFSVRELCLTGQDLQTELPELAKSQTSILLQLLLHDCVLNPHLNTRKSLLKLANVTLKSLGDSIQKMQE